MGLWEGAVRKGMQRSRRRRRAAWDAAMPSRQAAVGAAASKQHAKQAKQAAAKPSLSRHLLMATAGMAREAAECHSAASSTAAATGTAAARCSLMLVAW